MKFLVSTAAVVASLALAAPASAYTYVGSWEVDDGPSWMTVPAAYSGQEAAAMLFGGAASDYVISTVDSLSADVNFSAWISTWGGACGGSFPCGTIVGQSYVVSSGGLYENPGDTSTYVNDWAVGSQYTNYAFSAAPEPASWALMLVGFGALGYAARRKRAAIAA